MFNEIVVTGEVGKASRAVANKSDTGRNVLLSFHNLYRVMETERKISARF